MFFLELLTIKWFVFCIFASYYGFKCTEMHFYTYKLSDKLKVIS